MFRTYITSFLFALCFFVLFCFLFFLFFSFSFFFCLVISKYASNFPDSVKFSKKSTYGHYWKNLLVCFNSSAKGKIRNKVNFWKEYSWFWIRFYFLLDWLPLKRPVFFNIYTARMRKDGYMPFPRAFACSEVQTASSMDLNLALRFHFLWWWPLRHFFREVPVV